MEASMPRQEYTVPFVAKFRRPVISFDKQLLLLRFSLEDGSAGCIGLREESLETLETVIKEIHKRKREYTMGRD